MFNLDTVGINISDSAALKPDEPAQQVFWNISDDKTMEER